MKKNILITGASGMIGNELLKICIASDEVASVTSLVRKKGKITSPKLTEIVVADFSDYSNISSEFQGIDLVFFCLGVYTGAAPREEFRKITVDYPVNLAKKLIETNSNMTFCLLSGQGADRKEQSSMMFAKDKGTAENQLSALGFKAFYSLRPAYIYPVETRNEPNFSYKMMRSVYPLIKLLGKNMSVKSTELAQAMFNTGMKGASKEVLENRDILEMVGV
jgi:uncharacterized protein YbjT (DUF2867 family)